MPGSLTSSFPWSRWRGKRSQHSRRMRNPQFCVSGKKPINYDVNRLSAGWSLLHWLWVTALCDIYVIYEWCMSHLHQSGLDSNTTNPPRRKLPTIWRPADPSGTLFNGCSVMRVSRNITHVTLVSWRQGFPSFKGSLLCCMYASDPWCHRTTLRGSFLYASSQSMTT